MTIQKKSGDVVIALPFYKKLKIKICVTFERLWNRNKFPKLGKADIINLLGKTNDYTTYVEIASRTTGHKFADISDNIFPTKKRILYNIADDYSDGMPIHYSSDDLSGENCLQSILMTSETFDVVFSDPYHSYEASKIDLDLGFRLLNPGGIMVVHDCNPPSKDLASPEFKNGLWCGQTYLAFLDFTKEHPELEYCVIDTDWGIGLVFKTGDTHVKFNGRLPERPDLSTFDLRDWKVFSAYRKRILRLISVKKFYEYFVDDLTKE